MSSASKRWLLVGFVILVGGFAAYGWLDMSEIHPDAVTQVEHPVVVAVAPVDVSEPVEREAIRQEAAAPIAVAVSAERTITLERMVPLPAPVLKAQQTPVDAPQFVERGLPAEAPMMTADGPNVRELGRLMKDGDYDEFLDRLIAQAATDALAVELTELYSSSAAASNQQVPDVDVLRFACGRILCAGVVRAASEDAFQGWSARFRANPAATPHAMGIYATANADGTQDYRFSFSNDPNRRAAVHPGGSPARIGN